MWRGRWEGAWRYRNAQEEEEQQAEGARGLEHGGVRDDGEQLVQRRDRQIV